MAILQLTIDDEHDLSLRDFDNLDGSVRSLNSSMSSVTMLTSDFYSGDSMSTIRTDDQHFANDYDARADHIRVEKPSSGRSAISDLTPISFGESSHKQPKRFSSSSKESSADTMPVIPRRDMSVCSSCPSQISSDSSKTSLAGSSPRTRAVKKALAAAISKSSSGLPPPPPPKKKPVKKKPASKDVLPCIVESPNPKRKQVVSSTKSPKSATRKSAPKVSKSTTRSKEGTGSSPNDTALKVPRRQTLSPKREKTYYVDLDSYGVKKAANIDVGSGHTASTATTVRMSSNSSWSSSSSSGESSDGSRSKRASAGGKKKKLKSKKSFKASKTVDDKASKATELSSPASPPMSPPGNKRTESSSRRSPGTRRQSIVHRNVPARSLPRSQQKLLKKQRSAMNVRRSMVKDCLAIILEDDGEEVDVLTSTLAAINSD